MYLLNFWMDLVNTCHAGRYLSKVLCCTILIPLNDLQGHGIRNFMLKFLVKVIKSLYLLTHLIELVDTLPDVIYWSKVLCCIIPTPVSDLDVKVTDIEILFCSTCLFHISQSSEIFIFQLQIPWSLFHSTTTESRGHLGEGLKVKV